MAPTSSSRIRISKTERKATKPHKKKKKKKLVKLKMDEFDDNIISTTATASPRSTPVFPLPCRSNSSSQSIKIHPNHYPPDKFDSERSSFNDDDFSTSTASATGSPCSTPKAERFRIQEMKTCPPPPKKQTLLSNCLLQTTPVSFFAPPDLELFFFFALRDIKV